MLFNLGISFYFCCYYQPFESYFVKRSKPSSKQIANQLFPDLWSTPTAEKGIQLLANLDFPAAEAALLSWLDNRDIESLEVAEPAGVASTRACQAWHNILIQTVGTTALDTLNTNIDLHAISALTDSFIAFDFGRYLKNFSNNLLLALVGLSSRFLRQQPISSKACPEPLYLHLQKLSMLLLGYGYGSQQLPSSKQLKEAATQLLQQSTLTYAADGRLLELLCGAYYQNKQKAIALDSYMHLMISFPLTAANHPTSLIPYPSALTALLENNPPIQAAAIGYIQGIFTTLIKPQEQLTLQQQGFENDIHAYNALYTAEQLLRSGKSQLNQITEARKRLLALSPAIGKSYLQLIQTREGQK